MDCRRRSFALGVACTWNSLPEDVVAPETLGSFERIVRCCWNEKLFFIRLACFVKIFCLIIACLLYWFDYYSSCVLLFLSFSFFLSFRDWCL